MKVFTTVMKEALTPKAIGRAALGGVISTLAATALAGVIGEVAERVTTKSEGKEVK